MIFWNMIFDIGGYREVSVTGLMVVRVSFEVKVAVCGIPCCLVCIIEGGLSQRLGKLI